MYCATVILKNYLSVRKAKRAIQKRSFLSIRSAGAQSLSLSPTYVRSGTTCHWTWFRKCETVAFNSSETEIFPKKASDDPLEVWYILRRNRGRHTKCHVRHV